MKRNLVFHFVLTAALLLTSTPPPFGGGLYNADLASSAGVEARHNSIPRYAMFSLVWRFSHNPKNIQPGF